MPALRRACLGITVIASLLLGAGCSGPVGRISAVTGQPTPVARPNIVFVLTDDLSTNLVPYMPNVLTLQRDGTTFSNYTVTDSLCCPSRVSILTGRYPHNTGIFKNHGSDGGFRLFHRRGGEASTFATDLRAAGYRTAYFGKYLNEYQPTATLGLGPPYVPPGWDEWYAGGSAYGNFDYALNENHSVVRYGDQPQHYLTDVLAGKAVDFIAASAARGTPFMMEVSTYTPHSPYTPAPRDADAFPGLRAPREPAFDTRPVDAPPWLAGHPPLTAQRLAELDTVFRKRVQAVQSVDRMLGALRVALAKAGVAGQTIVIFSSDNGYHLGEHRLGTGKQTAFDTDVNVPLVVAGRGVRAGRVVPALVENVDLRPTFAGLAGARTPADVDGRDFAPLLAADAPPDWRRTALVEHRDPAADPADPDYQKVRRDIPPSYNAMRTADYTYVEYVDGSREYYDRRADPYQLRNTAAKLPPARLAALRAALGDLTACRGQHECWAAGRRLA